MEMSINVRPELIDFESPVAPNFKSSNILTQKVYPQSNIIGAAQNASGGFIDGQLEFIYTVPAGYKQDVSRSYILFDVTIGINANPVTAIVTTAPAFNMPSAFFSNAKFELSDRMVSYTNNCGQDDTLFKRLTQSYAKYTSNESRAFMYGDDDDRFNAVQTKLRQQLSWQPQVLMNPEMIIPENVKCHLLLSVNPLINTAANSPCFTNYTNAAGDGLVYFHGIHMVNTYVKVDNPTPMEVFLPAYAIKSSFQTVGSTSNNLQFTVDKDVYKLAVALQSSAATLNTGAETTKFNSGSGAGGGAQNAYSRLLTGLQVNYAGQNYPSTLYSLLESATVSKSTEAYLDFLGACNAVQDPSGSEPYSIWSDCEVNTEPAYGRIFAWSVVTPKNNSATTVEVTANFSTAPTTTRLILFGITRTIYSLSLIHI